jgi:hypothetical protein
MEGGGGEWTHTEKFWKCFLLSKYRIPLYQKREAFVAFLPFSFFLCFFLSLFFYSPSLYWGWTQGFLKCLRRKHFFQTFFQMGWKWLHQDLWNWESCGKFIGGGSIPWNGLMHANKLFFGEASSEISQRKNDFEKFKSSRRTHPLTKLNENKSFYVKYIWL